SDPNNENIDKPDYCDGVDNNCNNEIDEDRNDPDNLLGKPCSAGKGTCRAVATYVCDSTDVQAEPICPAEPLENAVAETCDYTDEDCDGVIDNDFINGDGIYDQVENC